MAIVAATCPSVDELTPAGDVRRAEPVVESLVIVGRATDPPRRPSAGYDLDFALIYAAAAASGTALEIDGAPAHLGLDGEHAREAVSAGVTVTIDSDCHKAALLERQMRLGVGTARRGWVEARHVLNTRSIEEGQVFHRGQTNIALAVEPRGRLQAARP